MVRYSAALNLERIRAEQMDVRDVAHELSGIHRFIGQTRTRLPVAWHSLMVAQLCRGEGKHVARGAGARCGRGVTSRLDPPPAPPNR